MQLPPGTAAAGCSRPGDRLILLFVLTPAGGGDTLGLERQCAISLDCWVGSKPPPPFVASIYYRLPCLASHSARLQYHSRDAGRPQHGRIPRAANTTLHGVGLIGKPIVIVCCEMPLSAEQNLACVSPGKSFGV